MQDKIFKFLYEMLIEQYGNELTNKIIDGYSKERLVTLRVNTIKTNVDDIKKKLTEAGITYRDVSWYKNALIIENAKEYDIRKLEMYENGEIYLQSLSSMIPPIILSPREKENILDMASAPRRKNYADGNGVSKQSNDYSLWKK